MPANDVPIALVKETKELIQACLLDDVVDAGEVLKIGMFVAQKVGPLAKLTADEKKDLVVLIVKEALQDVLTETQYQQVGSTLVQVLPSVLEIAVQASQGTLSLRELVSEAPSKGWLGCLSACWAVLAPVAAPKKVVHAAPATTQAPPAPAQPALEPVSVLEPSGQAPPLSEPATLEVRAPSETTALPEVSPSEEPQTEPNRVASDEDARE